jgi:HK97 family phage portal protein
VKVFGRSIRPSPASVGPDYTPGDPDGLTIEEPGIPYQPPPPPVVQPWSGWPANWSTPNWNGQLQQLTDTAWMCLDYNTGVLASMPPYLVNASSNLDASWIINPDPDVYTCWEDFVEQLFWDYQLGEAFVICTARYSTGWPARFHVVPPWSVDVDFNRDGMLVYRIGDQPVPTGDILHVRYQWSTGDARGHGPLEAGNVRVVADQVLIQYATGLVTSGGVPSSVLTSPARLDRDQADLLKQQWLTARLSSLGEPAVLSGGVTWQPTQMNPEEMALIDLTEVTENRIAHLLKVPAVLVGIPSGQDSLVYSTALMYFMQHWRGGLRPKAQKVMAALSGWALPRGTWVELNSDSYVQPEPLQRAQAAQILNSIKDEQGNPVLTVQEIRVAERLDNSQTGDLQAGVLR